MASDSSEGFAPTVSVNEKRGARSRYGPNPDNKDVSKCYTKVVGTVNSMLLSAQFSTPILLAYMRVSLPPRRRGTGLIG